MEDHLRNKDRLMKEWEALCSYQAEPSGVSLALSDANAKKNRCPDSVPCESHQHFNVHTDKHIDLNRFTFINPSGGLDDHSRVKLRAEINPSRSDYINASTIVSPCTSDGSYSNHMVNKEKRKQCADIYLIYLIINPKIFICFPCMIPV